MSHAVVATAEAHFESLQRRASLVGGIYHDAHAMALLR